MNHSLSLVLHPMQGMIAAAHAVQIKLESERVLEKAFKENKVIRVYLHVQYHYWGVHGYHIMYRDTAW